jgi:hypothetical protein
MLSGAASGVVGAASSGVAEPSGVAVSPATTGVSPSMPPSVLGGHGGGMESYAGGERRMPFGEEAAWQRDERGAVEGPDDQPPPVVGRQNATA